MSDLLKARSIVDEREQQLVGLLQEYAAKASEGDFAGWLSLWCDDAVQMPAGAPARTGTEAIREAMEPAFSAFHLAVEISQVHLVSVGESTGYTVCDYRITGMPKGGGAPVEIMGDGKALTVFRRRTDGSWGIACDCVNSNAE